MSAPRTSAAALALGLTLALTACGSDAPEPVAAGTNSTSPSPATSSTPTQSAPKPVRPKGAELVTGSGYSFALPKGWVDLTRKMRRDQPSLDVAVGSSVQTDGFASNLAVYVTQSGETGTDTIDDVADQILARVRERAPKFRILPHTEVGGLPAARLAGMYQPAKNQRYWLEQFVVVGQEQTTVISFSLAPTSSAKERAALIDSVLKSWMIES